jgi:hypothetical protein
LLGAGLAPTLGPEPDALGPAGALGEALAEVRPTEALAPLVLFGPQAAAAPTASSSPASAAARRVRAVLVGTTAVFSSMV